MRSNCLFFAIRLFFRRKAVGYVTFRKSHWGNFPHFFYAERHHIIQYVPTDPKLKACPPPIFHGRIKWGGEIVGRPEFSPPEGWVDA